MSDFLDESYIWPVRVLKLNASRFQTYFPHVDNVYSHRSTQRHKRKPFVSSYWDCRLKGRPPGTPKSTDPNKKKRKRSARERDLCDVKIKITEYSPGARLVMSSLGHDATDADAESLFAPEDGFAAPSAQLQPFGVLAPTDVNMGNVPGANGERYYTIMRVNGSNGNGKNDGKPGPHKHTLEDSDRVKKCSVVREVMKEEKERKKCQVSGHSPSLLFSLVVREGWRQSDSFSCSCCYGVIAAVITFPRR